MRTVAFQTLGCKLNFSESSDLGRKFQENGFQVVDFSEKADVYVINTCTVTSIAEKKCRNAIRQAIHLNPDAIVAAIGCFAEINPQEIEKIKGIHYILGNAEKHKLVDYILAETEGSSCASKMTSVGNISDFVPSYSTGDRTRSFLKIQDGCDYFCTYCAIPFARGRSRSLTIKETVEKAKEVAEKDIKEVILTGINIGDFGKQHNESFFGLIQELDKVEGIERYRISSIEPDLLSGDIIEFVAKSKKFLPHFHIPLQSGSEQVLKAMKRRYSKELFAERVYKIKSVMPDACIAADVIVGFNHETDEAFQEAYDFLDSLPISYLHIFTYSERPNTYALQLDGKVPVSVRRERSKILHELSEKKKLQFYQENQGTSHSVLWEGSNNNGFMTGFTENYIKVKRPFDAELENQIHRITLKTLDADQVYTC
ncbi:tRNA (N(6)-L-threonylcarbamoyladenosine(37)-C(2))-methylthiotransferase MtaB [Bacteroidales bacterium OttesenSCG-928-C19]|nr:tRNA (N(6)-L-threonylcarbamoyladenosine(37)-C(2))-methylthiotransferase MtaB [Bacteroidales bacterium OttesenSCG-928-C19]